MMAVLTIGACTINASAESSYLPGDVNMNGKVDTDDANMVLWEYLYVGVMEMEGTFTAEQLEFGNVYHPNEWHQSLNAADSQCILVDYLLHDVVQDMDVSMEEFVNTYIPL